jgi:tetratricopeptide (TPR) repeat protein
MTQGAYATPLTKTIVFRTSIMERRSSLWLAGLAILIASAAPRIDPVELIRQGNAAFSRGDFPGALAFYNRAESRVQDPGLVAFNKASAFYHTGNFRAAELLYRASLSDAEGVRRVRLLYSLANCLVQQAGDRDTKRLREAIGFYEQSISEENDPEEMANARHNLELAKLLLIKAQQQADKNPPDQPPDRDPDVDPPPKKGSNDIPEGTDPGPGIKKNGGDKIPSKVAPGEQTQRTNEPPAPGQGNLPPIPDTQDPVTLTPEDAAAHLQQATVRILQERQKHKQTSLKKPAPGAKDW